MARQYLDYRLIVVLALVHCGCLESKEFASIQETCLMETFHAQCLGDNIIVMKSALYGRIRPGKCAPANTGAYGCIADVMTYFDAQCSGKGSCDVAINAELVAHNVCPHGLLPYLETSYICVPVIPDALYNDACQRDGMVTFSGYSVGAIASSTVFSSRLRSRTCPSIIQAKTGQRINITLVDLASHQAAPSGSRGMETPCNKYAVLVERSSATPTNVCGGTVRQRNVYMSKSNQLEIRYPDIRDGDTPPNFLIKFSLYGCPDLNLNGHDLVESTPEIALLHCESTGKTTQLYCRGNQWNVEVSSCVTQTGYIPESWSSFQGLIITLCVGIVIGMSLGFIVLCCVCICIKRRSRSKRSQPRQIVYYEGNARWNAGKRIDNWDMNNGTMQRHVDYNPRTLRRDKDTIYESVYDPIHHDTMMIENKDLPSRFNMDSRNIFTDLPPPPIPVEYPEDTEPPYAKPV